MIYKGLKESPASEKGPACVHRVVIRDPYGLHGSNDIFGNDYVWATRAKESHVCKMCEKIEFSNLYLGEKAPLPLLDVKVKWDPTSQTYPSL